MNDRYIGLINGKHKYECFVCKKICGGYKCRECFNIKGASVSKIKANRKNYRKMKK